MGIGFPNGTLKGTLRIDLDNVIEIFCWKWLEDANGMFICWARYMFTSNSKCV